MQGQQRLVVDERALGDLDPQTVGSEPGLAQHARYSLCDLWVTQLHDGEVDAEIDIDPLGT